MTASVIRRRPLASPAIFPDSLHPVLQRVYAARGLIDAGELQLDLQCLIPVGELGGVSAAVALLIEHFQRASRIVIVGDFDADGATSTALVMRQLTRLGFSDVRFVVPNRFEYGYGLTPEIVRLVAQQEPALIITVDNGISSQAGVEEARRCGIAVLITDHHLPGRTLPEAAAIVNPNVPGDRFPSKALAGVGVAFYLMAALTREMQARGLCGEQNGGVADLLDLVALGTVADLVALDYNNRILVHQGLRRIRAGRCVPGIRALLEAAGRRMDNITAADLGFQVGPRLNAAGRLDDMSVGIRCLLADDATAAGELAARLTRLNEDRRELELQMQQEAVAVIAEMTRSQDDLALGLCLFQEQWHQGVVGLVASRVKDRLHRPVIAFARADERMLKGSARSVSGVHMRDVLDAVATRNPGLIDKFGGHAMAAGLSIAVDDLETFRREFTEEVCRWMTPEHARGIIDTDGALGAAELSMDTAKALRGAGPWGQGFPEPMFDGSFGVIESRVLGERHLKLKVRITPEVGATGSTEHGPVCEAIAFRYFDDENAAGVVGDSRVDMAFRLDVNEYGGRERLQLVVQHLRALP